MNMNTKKLFTIILSFILSLQVFAEDIYSPQISYRLKYGKDLSHHMHSLLPIGGSENSILFNDIKVAKNNTRGLAGNFAIGYRSLFDDMIVGVYGSFDITTTKAGNNFKQATIGGELLFADHEYRINGYIPITGTKDTQLSIDALRFTQLSEHSFKVEADYIHEVQRYGFDIEGGFSLIKDEPSLFNVYACYYHFGAKDLVGIHGARLRLEYNPIEHVSLSAECSYDNVNKSNYYAGLKLSYSFSNSLGGYLVHDNLKKKMTQAIVRDEMMVDTQTIHQERTITNSTYRSKISGFTFKNDGTNTLRVHLNVPDNVIHEPDYIDYKISIDNNILRVDDFNGAGVGAGVGAGANLDDLRKKYSKIFPALFGAYDRDQSIKKAYCKLALEHHPDKGGDGTVFAQLTEAYNELLKLKTN